MSKAPSRTAALYTPDILALAVSLAEFPFDQVGASSGSARSRTCGSEVQVSLATDALGRIAHVGIRATACAVGQAAAALFARGARGLHADEVSRARDEIAGWLEGSRERPDWPGLDLLETARAHPARHGAILLAWTASLAALSNAKARG